MDTRVNGFFQQLFPKVFRTIYTDLGEKKFLMYTPRTTPLFDKHAFGLEELAMSFFSLGHDLLMKSSTTLPRCCLNKIRVRFNM